MKSDIKQTTKTSREGERGAALVMVLLISSLLLVAVAGLLMESSMNTADVTDATAEEQAYYAAESGIQSVVNVLRQNTVLPNGSLLDASKPTTDPANKIDYSKATRLSSSNITNPTAAQCAAASPPLDCKARLSRWMTYDTTYTDRVVLGDPPYSPANGFAYSVEVSDPDNVGGTISYSTPTASVKFDGVNSLSKTWPGATLADSATVTYEPYPGPASIDVSTGIATTNFGRFRLTTTGAGVTSFTRTRFSITINISQPYVTTKVLRGYFESGSITPGSTTAWILYDSLVYVTAGSTITLLGGAEYPTPPATDLLPPPDSYYRTGYRITPNAPNVTGAGETIAGATTIKATITAPEPIRLLIKSTGYGPLGARKQLESVIQKNYFNGLGAPSPLTLIGPPCTPVATCTAPAPTSTWIVPNFIFNPGTSAPTVYDGHDTQLHAYLPPVGLTNDQNYDEVHYALTHGGSQSFGGKVFGRVENIADDLPFWLQTPVNLAATIDQLKGVAQASGTYYGPGVTPPSSGNGHYGDPVTATGITFIDGPLEFSQEGGGILVVTGALTFKGGFTFNGLIVVTGPGGILRTGGGTGSLQGNMIVAPYDAASLTCSPQGLNCFLAPRYDISGGGSSEIIYNSNNVLAGLGEITNFVKGVAEK